MYLITSISFNKKAGSLDEHGTMQFPPLLNLSSERLERQGLFLLDNGLDLFFWVGRMCPPELLQMLFDCSVYDSLPVGKVVQLFNIPNNRLHFCLYKMIIVVESML